MSSLYVAGSLKAAFGGSGAGEERARLRGNLYITAIKRGATAKQRSKRASEASERVERSGLCRMIPN